MAFKLNSISVVTMKKVGLFALCLLICFSAAALGSLVTTSEIPNWYATINKPVFNPPNYVFAPVWTILYLLMSVALYKLITSSHPERKKMITVFVVQLVLNVLWSFIFFKWHLLTLAAAEIVVLLIVLIYFLVASMRVSRVASACFIPYVIWVSFATLLTISVAMLN